MPKPRKRGGSRAKRRGNGRGEMLSASFEADSAGRVKALGAEVDAMNAREKEIIAEMGQHQLKISKLSSEQTGIRVRRVQKLREIDAAAAE